MADQLRAGMAITDRGNLNVEHDDSTDEEPQGFRCDDSLCDTDGHELEE